MELDDDLCLCFHVSKRKVINFIRNEKPVAASQLSECYGAGSGCGWCRKYLGRLFDQMKSKMHGDQRDAAGGPREDVGEDSAETYANLRCDYLRKGHGTPPPGTS